MLYAYIFTLIMLVHLRIVAFSISLSVKLNHTVHTYYIRQVQAVHVQNISI